MVGIKLKEFQEKCVEELLEQTVFGEKKEILLQAPTGSGKTIMLLEYIDRFLLENKDYALKVLGIERGNAKPRKDIAKWSDLKENISYMYNEEFDKITERKVKSQKNMQLSLFDI